MTCTLFDDAGNQDAQVSATDTTHTSGGIAFLGSGDGVVTSLFFDNYRITG